MRTERQVNANRDGAMRAQWSVAIISQIGMVLLLITLASAQKKSSCIECHSRLEDPRLNAPAKLFDNDIHHARGLSCNDCHGGDPNADAKEAAKDPRKGYLAASLASALGSPPWQ